MIKTLYDYYDVIASLPLQSTYKKEQLLIPELLVEKQESIEIYYAPHNEYQNPEAKIFIVGITPGFQQMSTAIAAARKGIAEGKSIEEIQYLCKVAGRFSGVMRTNIINMLDEVELNHRLHMESCSELFGSHESLLHTISLIPYSVFVKGSNYTGHTPKLIKNKFLMNYVYDNFLREYKQLRQKESLVIIPLGSAVEEVLLHLEEEGYIEKNSIMKGFPHPSGANVNRLPKLREEKENIMKFLDEAFS